MTTNSILSYEDALDHANGMDENSMDLVLAARLSGTVDEDLIHQLNLWKENPSYQAQDRAYQNRKIAQFEDLRGCIADMLLNGNKSGKIKGVNNFSNTREKYATLHSMMRLELNEKGRPNQAPNSVLFKARYCLEQLFYFVRSWSVSRNEGDLGPWNETAKKAVRAVVGDLCIAQARAIEMAKKWEDFPDDKQAAVKAWGVAYTVVFIDDFIEALEASAAPANKPVGGPNNPKRREDDSPEYIRDVRDEY
jgi:hypothetical protein